MTFGWCFFLLVVVIIGCCLNGLCDFFVRCLVDRGYNVFGLRRIGVVVKIVFFENLFVVEDQWDLSCWGVLGSFFLFEELFCKGEIVW